MEARIDELARTPALLTADRPRDERGVQPPDAVFCNLLGTISFWGVPPPQEPAPPDGEESVEAEEDAQLRPFVSGPTSIPVPMATPIVAGGRAPDTLDPGAGSPQIISGDLSIPAGANTITATPATHPSPSAAASSGEVGHTASLWSPAEAAGEPAIPLASRPTPQPAPQAAPARAEPAQTGPTKVGPVRTGPGLSALGHHASPEGTELVREGGTAVTGNLESVSLEAGHQFPEPATRNPLPTTPGPRAQPIAYVDVQEPQPRAATPNYPNAAPVADAAPAGGIPAVLRQPPDGARVPVVLDPGTGSPQIGGDVKIPAVADTVAPTPAAPRPPLAAAGYAEVGQTASSGSPVGSPAEAPGEPAILMVPRPVPQAAPAQAVARIAERRDPSEPAAWSDPPAPVENPRTGSNPAGSIAEPPVSIRRVVQRRIASGSEAAQVVRWMSPTAAAGTGTGIRWIGPLPVSARGPAEEPETDAGELREAPKDAGPSRAPQGPQLPESAGTPAGHDANSLPVLEPVLRARSPVPPGEAQANPAAERTAGIPPGDGPALPEAPALLPAELAQSRPVPRRLRLDMDLPSLGAIRIDVSSKGSVAAAIVKTEEVATRLGLAAQAAQVQAALAAHGVRLAAYEVLPDWHGERRWQPAHDTPRDLVRPRARAPGLGTTPLPQGGVLGPCRIDYVV